MLRSLVGSEMCIRDRLDIAQDLKGRGAKRIFVAVTFALFVSGLSQYQACLLYTSDAADDLHCVDLGGRRIIKKKK